MSPDASVSVSTPATAPAGAPDPDLCADWPELDVLRRRYIHRMISHAGGNKSQAAKLLGIDRRTLNRTLARERAQERAAAAARALRAPAGR
jgi:DNA-binding NtrC family response regulator